MQPLDHAPTSTFAGIRFVLTDMDETLTHHGRLSARTYGALEQLQQAGIRVIPVTAAPAGWCEQMARMWPIDGVIAENGGLFLRRDGTNGVKRHYWHDDIARTAIAEELAEIGRRILDTVPGARYAGDQSFRLTSIAFERPAHPGNQAAIVDALRAAGARATANNLWVLGWVGDYDKLAMSRRIMAEIYGIDIATARDCILYSGDSENDAPMFAFFEHTIGVSTIRQHLDGIAVPPRWIANGPGGAGFVEAAQAVLQATASR